MYSELNLKYYAKYGSGVSAGATVIHINQEKYPGIFTVTKMGPGDESAINYSGVMFIELENNDGKVVRGVPIHNIRVIQPNLI